VKVLAFLLLFVNLGVWVAADYLLPPTRSNAAAGGQLPRVASLKIAPDTAVSGAETPSLLMCVSLGWFDSRSEAEDLLGRVRVSGGESAGIEEVERALEPLNWVIIPPQPEAQALHQFRAIQRQGIDSYLVTQGEYRNAISLGLFSSREAAQRVLEEKKRQNLNAVLVKYPRNQISYALNIRAADQRVDTVIASLRTEFGSEFDFVEINPCKGVARAEKNP